MEILKSYDLFPGTSLSYVKSGEHRAAAVTRHKTQFLK